MSTLYRKYRPQRWADLAGQNHVKVTLSFEVEAGKVAHAYLFSGPRGTGKTSVARILAKAVNCLDRRGGGEPCGQCEACVAVGENQTLDVIEIDAASHRGIDSVRENIIENARFHPARLQYKVFIIDEVHMLTTEAFNALLKTLEEPPPHVLFILATTELHKVPPTIVSRCQRFDFRKIPFEEIVTRLHMLAEREGIKVDVAVLREIARHADGGLRDAEGLLGKVLTVAEDKQVTYDQAMVVLPRSNYTAVATLVEALVRRDTTGALAVVDDVLESGLEIDQFMADVIETLRRVLLVKIGGNAETVTLDMDETRRQQLTGWKDEVETVRLIAMLELLMEKRRDVKGGHLPQLPLELAIARLCETGESDVKPRPAAPPTSHATQQPAKTYASQPTLAPSKPSAKKTSPQPPVAATLAVAQPSPVVAGLAPADHTTPSPATAPVLTATSSVIPANAGISAAPDVVSPFASPEPPVGATLAVARDSESVPTVIAPNSTTPAPVVPAHTPVTPTPDLPVSRLKQVWSEFTRCAGEENHSLPFLLGVSEPLEMAGGLVRVGFNYVFHRDKFNTPRNRATLEKALSSLLGTPVRLEGVMLDRKVEMYNNVTAEPGPMAPVVPEAPKMAPVGAIAGAEGFAAAFGGRVVG